MIDITKLQWYYANDLVKISAHAAERFRKRGITEDDARNVVMTGEIIEQYPLDFPYPSCLILGTAVKGYKLHLVMSDETDSARIITGYLPNKAKWHDDLKTRRDV